MKVLLTLRCRCGCGESEVVEHYWSPDVNLEWIHDFQKRFYPGASFELRSEAPKASDLDRIVREKTVRVVLEEQSREALNRPIPRGITRARDLDDVDQLRIRARHGESGDSSTIFEEE